MGEILQKLLANWGLVSQGLHSLSPILLFLLGLFLIFDKRAASGEHAEDGKNPPRASPDEGLAEQLAPPYEPKPPQSKPPGKLWLYLGQVAIVVGILDYAGLNLGIIPQP